MAFQLRSCDLASSDVVASSLLLDDQKKVPGCGWVGVLKRDDLPSVLEPKWPQKDSNYIIDLDAIYDIC